MEFQIMDLETWPRRETFLHFLEEVPCTYSITVELDITRLWRETRGIGLFPALLYGLSRQVNCQEAFRMDFNEAGQVGVYRQCSPCYTVFHPETEGFTNVWTEYDPVFSTFCRNYRADRERYRGDFRHGKPDAPPNLFSVSCVPWASFTGFHLDLPKGDIPICGPSSPSGSTPAGRIPSGCPWRCRCITASATGSTRPAS